MTKFFDEVARTIALAVPMSVIAVLPAVARVYVHPPQTSMPMRAMVVFIALWGSAVVPVSAWTWVLLHAERAARAFSREGKKSAFGFMMAKIVLLTAVLAAIVLCILCAVLRMTTHHHALAGLTFACVGLEATLLMIPIASRAILILNGRFPSSRIDASFVWGLSIALGGFVGMAMFGASHSRGLFVDACVAAAVVMIATRHRFQDWIRSGLAERRVLVWVTAVFGFVIIGASFALQRALPIAREVVADESSIGSNVLRIRLAR